MINESECGVESEYASLRQEILARIKIRQQLIAGTLTLAAAFLGLGLKFPIVALVYPPIAAFLVLAWHQNNLRVRDIAEYIRVHIEPKFVTPGWETHMYGGRVSAREKGPHDWSLVLLSHGGFFIFTEVLAIVLGGLWLLEPGSSLPGAIKLPAWILAVSDIAAFLVTLWLIIIPLPVETPEAVTKK